MSRRTICINPMMTHAYHVPIGLLSPLKPNLSLAQRMSRPESAVVFHKIGGPEVLAVEAASPRQVAENDVRINVAAFALNREHFNVHPRRALHHPVVPFAHWVGGSGYGHRDRRKRHRLQHRRPRHEHSLLHRNRRRAGNNSRPTGGLPNPCSTGSFGCPGLLCLDAISHVLLRIRRGSQSRMRRHSAHHCRRQFGRAWRHRDRTRTWGEGGRCLYARRRSGRSSFEAGANEVALVGVDDLGEVIDRTTDGKGVRVAFDPVGGDSLGTYVDHLAPNAVIFGYGTLSDLQPVIPMAAMCRTQSVFHPYSMFNHVGRADERRRGVDFIL